MVRVFPEIDKAARNEIGKERPGWNPTDYHASRETDNGCFGNSWKTEKNKKCEIGGFAVKKTATCRLWKLNERLL